MKAESYCIGLTLLVIMFTVGSIVSMMDYEKQIDSQEAYIIELQETAHNLADKAQDYQTQILELQQDKQLLMQILSKSKLYDAEVTK